MIHRIARTYGRLPHEVLALDLAELALASMCIDAAERQAAADIGDGQVMAILDVRG